ncbi:MAG: 30S ribosomal protein S12 methylthiotransferase RimO [Pseudomonadota bacterium]
MSKKVGFVSLGCPKALVDSERMMTQLRHDGYALVSDYSNADVVVVNTCGFVDEAKAESLATIDTALNENGKVIVTGCLGAAGEEIRDSFPKVLSISGPQQYETVISAVREHAPIINEHDPFRDLIPAQGIKLTPSHYAYLKISEGCNHHCSFCIIPSMRGRLRSRLVDDVFEEARVLKNNGVKELLIVSQDTSAYGSDLKYPVRSIQGNDFETSFVDLCEALASLEIWVRLHYVYPYPHVDKVIPLMAAGKVLPYLDIPFQHASPSILKAMRRPAASENTLRRVGEWREQCPDLTIRSTFIVGFPGETDDDFLQLLDFLSKAELDRVGCFKYSPVEGAAANALANPVAETIKDERYEQLMAHQQTISTKRLAARRGQRVPVIVDEVSDERIVARSAADAPEIDGLVYLALDSNVDVGDIVEVTIEDSDEYDMFASLAEA